MTQTRTPIQLPLMPEQTDRSNGADQSLGALAALAGQVLAAHAPGCRLGPFRISTRMRRTLGMFTPGTRQVTLSARLLALGGPDEVRQVLLHELAHAIVHFRSVKAPVHGSLFRQVCREIGVRPSKYVDVVTRGWHERTRFAARCPSCRAELLRRRRVASARCACGALVTPVRWRVIVESPEGAVELGTTASPRVTRRRRIIFFRRKQRA